MKSIKKALNLNFVFLILFFVVYFSPNECVAKSLLSTIQDPSGDVGVSYLDIHKAEVYWVNEDVIQFVIQVGGTIPSSPTEDSITFIWFLDVDQNPSTGQKHFFVGSEYNVRVAYFQGNWAGYVDVINPGDPGGGQGSIFIKDNKVYLQIAPGQIGNPSAFNWEVGSFASFSGGDNANEYNTAVLNPPPPPSGDIARIYLTPEVLQLRSGTTSGLLLPTIYDWNDEPLNPDAYTKSFFCTSPGKVSITNNGVVNANPGIFGSVSVTALVNEIISDNETTIRIGKAFLTPPVLHLDMVNHTTDTVSVYLEDCLGNQLLPSEHTISYSSSNPNIATVDDSGKVTALSPYDATYIMCTLDGVSLPTATVVRVLDGDYGVPPINEFCGSKVSFWFPPDYSAVPSGMTLEEMVNIFDLVQTSDLAYQLEQELTGCVSFLGEMQFYIFEGGENEGTRVCGISGNPVRLGMNLTDPEIHNCIQLYPDGDPHWGVMYHEMGHNFTGPLFRFFEAFQKYGGPSSGTYMEGLATLCGMFAMERLTAHPQFYGLDEDALRSLNDPWIYGSIAFLRVVFGNALEDYVAGGSNYNTITADILDGMLIQLGDTYGWEYYPRFFNVFLPQNRSFGLEIDSEIKRATLFVAALSAAFKRDLRSKFRDDWGFPIDETFYAGIWDKVNKWANLRGKNIKEWCKGDFDGDGDVDKNDLAIFAADFGRTNCSSGFPCKGDFDGDGDVDGTDLAIFSSEFGRTDCPR